MEKFKKILRIPALCCATGLFVVLLIALIVVSTKTYSLGTYVYEDSIAGNTIKFEVTLEKGNDAISGVTTIAANGETNYHEGAVKYKVTNGELFTAEINNQDNYTKVGKIDAFELSCQENGVSIVMTNHSAVNSRTTMIVFMIISLAGAIASGVYTILSKKFNY